MNFLVADEGLDTHTDIRYDTRTGGKEKTLDTHLDTQKKNALIDCTENGNGKNTEHHLFFHLLIRFLPLFFSLSLCGCFL